MRSIQGNVWLISCNHLRPIEGTETQLARPRPAEWMRCNHLRPIEGTETRVLRKHLVHVWIVATTYDPLRVLKHRSVMFLSNSTPRCNHLRPIEGTETQDDFRDR